MTTSPTVPTDLTIEPLTPARMPDLASLFEQGGDPANCWCTWFRLANPTYAKATVTDKRAHLDGLAQRSPAPGLVAYRDGRAVGWVSLGPRRDFDRLVRSTVLGPIDDRPAWSIVCFVVGRRERDQGVARALLAAAIEHARVNGATLLEAYPADTGGRRISAAGAFHGTLSMFERAGFEVAAVRQASANAAPRTIVRREL